MILYHNNKRQLEQSWLDDSSVWIWPVWFFFQYGLSTYSICQTDLDFYYIVRSKCLATSRMVINNTHHSIYLSRPKKKLLREWFLKKESRFSFLCCALSQLCKYSKLNYVAKSEKIQQLTEFYHCNKDEENKSFECKI